MNEDTRLRSENERLRRTLTYIRDTAELDGIPQLVGLCDEALNGAGSLPSEQQADGNAGIMAQTPEAFASR